MSNNKETVYSDLTKDERAVRVLNNFFSSHGQQSQMNKIETDITKKLLFKAFKSQHDVSVQKVQLKIREYFDLGREEARLVALDILKTLEQTDV